MRRITIFLLFMVFIFSTGIQAQEREYTIMQPDQETRQLWAEYYENAPAAPMAKQVKSTKGSKTLISHLNYNALERDQGSCGNCWAWAGTGCMEIALHVQDKLFKRLSVQYINSCETQMIGKACCSGGWLQDFVNFYNAVSICVPWSNEGAYYQDGDASCDTPCSSISIDPSYPINSIGLSKIQTRGIGKEAAIANIKSMLDQDKAVWFSFFIPSSDGWSAFFDFWGIGDEAIDLWNPDFMCGETYGEGAGGHAVLCVGYNDDNPDHRYWIMVNSWGTTKDRSGGMFLLDMDIDYDCGFEDNGQTFYALYWQVLDIDFNIATPTPTPLPGDTCGTAINASDGGIFSHSTFDYNNYYNPYYGATWPYIWGMPGPDFVYQIDLKSMEKPNMIAKIDTADFDQSLYVMQDCSDPGGTLIVASDQYANFTGEEISCKFPATGTYYVVVDRYHPLVFGDFDINIILRADDGPTPTPSPTPTHTPTPTPTPFIKPAEYTYYFESNSQGWTTFSMPETFDEPLFTQETGTIGFSPNGSNSCYGSWLSPYHTFTVGQKYRARFHIRSDQSDASKVPGFRIRVEDKNSQCISTLNINSLGSGENSPTLSGKTYEMVYQPPANSHGSGYCFSVDLINIGDGDDANTNLLIDTVEIKTATVTVP